MFKSAKYLPMINRLCFCIALLTTPMLAQAAVTSQTESPGQSPGLGFEQCRIDIPEPKPVTTHINDDSIDQQSILVSANRTELSYESHARFIGDVEFIQGQRVIQADYAEVDQQQQIMTARGNLLFTTPAVTLQSQSLTAQMDGYNTELQQADYWFNGQQVHGHANSFRIQQGRYLILDKATFTTCPGDQPDWLLRAAEIKIDSQKEWAEIHQATIEVADIPVLYLPYLTLPISDKRTSGFLFPKITTSTSNGLDLSLPYYFNLAPNYDLLLTPRQLTNRGFQLNTEFRYLLDEQQGELNLEYLGSDDKLNGEDRYLINWQHQAKLDSNWRLNTDYTQVSDDNYFNDLGSKVANRTDNQLYRTANLGYYQDDWWIDLKLQDIQVLGSASADHKLLPQLSFHSYENQLWQDVEFDIFSEISNFSGTNHEQDDAVRWHLEPVLRYPLNLPSGSLTSEVKLMQTYYWQDENGEEEQLDRTLPQVRIHGVVNLERESQWFGQTYQQTLEPQFQYLYVPYEDQSDINLYDTTILRDDYNGLFRPRRFTGLDRIADANQLSLGLTTRFSDDRGQETMSLSLGQIFYMEDSELAEQEGGQDNDFNSSALAAEIDLKASKHWYLSSGIQLNEHDYSVNQSKATIDYRLDADRLMQLSHRYVRDISNNRINQLGLHGTWPVNEDWTMVTNMYRDLHLKRTIETFVGLQYESCCWAVRLSYSRYLNTNYEVTANQVLSSDQEDFESRVSISFQIKGLGSTGRLGVEDMLNSGLFSYRKPFYLNN